MAAVKQVNIALLFSSFLAQSFHHLGKKVVFVYHEQQDHHIRVRAINSAEPFSLSVFRVTALVKTETCNGQVLEVVEQYLKVTSIFAFDVNYRRLLFERKSEGHF